MGEGFRGVRRRTSRRRFLYGAAALGGMALPSCSGVSAARSGRIVHFWNLFGGGDGAKLTDMQSTFVESNPQIELESTTLTWGAPYYTKLSMSTVGGRPPEVAVMHQTRLGAYASAGLLEPLDPDMLAGYDIGPDKFLPEVLESARYRGEIYTVHVPFYETGETAVRVLFDNIAGEVEEPERVILPVELVVRESCGGNRVEKINPGKD